MSRSDINKALEMVAAEEDGASYLARRYGIKQLRAQLEKTRKVEIKELLSDAIELRRWR